MTVAEVHRPLSPMERWYWIADQISPLNVIARVRLSGALAESALTRAAADLAAEHPLLRVSIAADAEGRNPEFVPVYNPEIPIRTVTPTAAATDAWEYEVDTTELGTALDWRTRPLARIVDIAHQPGTPGEYHDLILTVSHVIADGTTALALLRDLVEYAAGNPPDGPAAHRPPLPPLEELLPSGFQGVRGLIRAVGTAIADQAVSLVTRPRRLEPQTVVDAHSRRTRLWHRELSGDQLEALIERCRAEGVTVHGALTAAMALALGRAVAPGQNGRIGIGSPIDFRGELHPVVSPDEAGAYVCTVPSFPRFGEVDLWDVARELNQDLLRRKRFRQHLALIALLRLATPESVSASARTVALLDQRGPGNVCISNIGRYDFPEKAGDWVLSGAQFIAGISISGYFVATVNTSHGVLHWNFTYIEGAVSDARARQLADDSLEILSRELTRPEPAVRKG
ncbi:phthiocerol/phthiodiolone dimycocerosyl transferase family protein [Nocardia huaxiensis]|uniref:Phthiocerol/phthiodiolone dimycocerosyl transferase n=1 Tax=Nocardia huaxiensis TaxID=2755382 RepID=A0A7D6ZL79_9NOCA|nr:short-chain dehydrogenase [Nocardia huaxiensis]QLY33327.1 short-chain dehydrogenase [Nocardia huaxiensis]UFS99767.1 hypothetical protein LPY97_18760 [Nocardia huaxiensis]